MKMIDCRFSEINKTNEPMILLMGKFDGVHKGHMKLIQKALEISNKNLKIAVLSLYPNPKSFYSNTVIKDILTKDEKKKKLEKLGVDYYYSIKFDNNLASLNKEVFIQQLKNKFVIEHIILGEDYKFGYNAEGNVDDLKSEFSVITVEEVCSKDERISSTAIRNKVFKNEFSDMDEVLGHKYIISGKVVYGRQIGTEIGFPTANIKINKYKLYPKHGVYKCFVKYNNNKYLGLVNIGNNPTVTDENILKIEVHIVNFNEIIYGNEIELFILKKIRDEKKFMNIVELKKQLQNDIEVLNN